MAVIYFIYNEPLAAMKIGKADDALERMAMLQTANAATLSLIGSIPLVPGLESWLHRHFAAKHIRGEWYRVTVEEANELIRQFNCSSPCIRIALSMATTVELPERLLTVPEPQTALRDWLVHQEIVVPQKPVRIGRPPLDPRRVRNKRLEVRFSSNELKRIKRNWRAAVDPEEVSFSQWVRERLGVA